MKLPEPCTTALLAYADRLEALATAAEAESPGPWEVEPGTPWSIPEEHVSGRYGCDSDMPGWDVIGPYPRLGVLSTVATAWGGGRGIEATDEDAEPVATLIAATAAPDVVRGTASALRLTVEALERTDHPHDHTQDNPYRAACRPCGAAEAIATALGLAS